MELFNILSLNEIAELINVLGASKDDAVSKGKYVNVNGKNIYYNQYGHNGSILSKGENGQEPDRLLTVNLGYSRREEKDYQGNTIVYLSHEASIYHYFDDGSSLHLFNTFSLPRGYSGFEWVQRHDLLDGLKITYVDRNANEVASFSSNLNKVRLSKSQRKYEFTEEGIKFDNIVVSPDGETILSINGYPVPSQDDIGDFKVEKEQALLKAISENLRIHKYTQEALEEASKYLDKKAKLVDSINAYYDNDIVLVKRAIEVRNKVISGIHTDLLNSEEIQAVADELRKGVKRYNKGTKQE